jgi:hypothetical protein
MQPPLLPLLLMAGQQEAMGCPAATRLLPHRQHHTPQQQRWQQHLQRQWDMLLGLLLPQKAHPAATKCCCCCCCHLGLQVPAPQLLLHLLLERQGLEAFLPRAAIEYLGPLLLLLLLVLP